MGIFDPLGSTISHVGSSLVSGASNAITAVEHGLASGLSAATNALSGVTSALGNLSGGVSGILSVANSFGSSFVSLSGPANSEFPLPNPLFDYATYNCLIGLAALPKDFLENPDSTYRVGARAPLIAKSASIDPENRVRLAEGSFEFYIDDLKIHSMVGWEQGKNSNAQTMSFKIFEPYSMGLFFEALQVTAQKLGFKNWTDAPYMITIEFQGNKETGQMEFIPKTDRQIPINITDIQMRVTNEGTHYDCVANPYNQAALTDGFKNFQSDLAIKGTTVQEMLQSGPKSLESVINQKLREVAKINNIERPDRILILFPKEAASEAASSGSTSGDTEANPDTNAATTASDPVSVSDSKSVTIKLNVTESEHHNLIQSKDDVNDIGRAKMGFSQTRRGDAPMGNDKDVYDAEGKIMSRNQNPIDVNQSDMKFRQDTDILNAINQVILQSEFIDQTLDPGAVTAEGYKGWWNIDTQVYIIGEMNKATGVPPKLLVYRVLPYKLHMSSGPTPPNVKPAGVAALKKQAVKEYNYIYTGKNVDILKFDINFKANFRGVLLADGGTANQSVVTQSNTGGSKENNVPEIEAITPGNNPSTAPSIPTSVSYFQTLSNTDKFGGGGAETQATRAARMFHDSVTAGFDMMSLDMTIVGDPYYIAMSGTGNYTAQASTENLNEDGSISYQTGEVHIVVNFRTPIDIDLNKGLYNFGSNPTVPVHSFSGLYRVQSIDSTFSKNQFTQDLHLFRIRNQELAGAGTASAALAVTRTEPYKGPPDSDETGGGTSASSPASSDPEMQDQSESGAGSTEPGSTEGQEESGT